MSVSQGHISDCKIKANNEKLTLDLSLSHVFAELNAEERGIAIRYQIALSNRHVLDFADLVFYTRAMLRTDPGIRQRWQSRFDFIQVDEIQDTHLTEYDIVSCLAEQSGNLALIGDLDQTIYEWRGSEPGQVIAQFQAEFSPEHYPLMLNYRATKALLQIASAFADGFVHRHTSILPAPTCDEGEAVITHQARTARLEAQWIGSRIQHLAQTLPAFHYSRAAILTRTNNRAEQIAKVLSSMEIPCLTVEQYQFFQRQEIKDALAHIRFIVNPFDVGAFKRLALVPSRGIGIKTLRDVYRAGETCGLLLTDLAMPQPFCQDDPLGYLSEAYWHGTIVVFDVETTGFSVNDDIVEIAAVKLVNGVIQDRFHSYISDAAPVGDTQAIHGYSDSFLRQNGQPAHSVLEAFCQFAAGSVLVGHNVGFDIKMLRAHGQKVGVQITTWQWADTWNLAKRFVKADSYKLVNLVDQLGLEANPDHRAMNDVEATAELLAHLINALEQRVTERRAVIHRYGDAFVPLAAAVATWQTLSQTLRPDELLAHILEDSGLKQHYSQEPARTQNLQRLIQIFRENDDAALHPYTALRKVLEFTALAKNLDQLSQKDNQVVVITAHQSKGLEFDHVFVAGVSEGEFPLYCSVQQEQLEEEKRLFYVALTRAKQQLHVSCHDENDRGYPVVPSAFFQRVKAIALPSKVVSLRRLAG